MATVRMRAPAPTPEAPAVQPPPLPVPPQQPALRLVQLMRWRRPPAPRAPAPKKNLTATLREWHKKAGLTACVFLAWLACSGILLTRSNDLGFDVRRIDWPWLMKIYGLRAEPPRSGFSDGAHWLAVTRNAALLDGRPLAFALEQPLGLVDGVAGKQPVEFVATPESVLLLGADGSRIDELRSPVLPVSNVRRIGRPRGKVGIVVQDLDAYASYDGGDSWSSIAPAEVQWSSATALSEAQRGALLPYSRPSVLLEQLLIDLHSGRLFGRVGAWIITLVGFGALWLALSGVWMWWRINQNRRRATPR
ncbi:MAG TPA: PepSY-associated TM helix domain-containing protein [Nevskiaceae bacterium]|nr:PepSY-associated TM helix domain-containing protein [Nevskiaceae bacterium]